MAYVKWLVLSYTAVECGKLCPNVMTKCNYMSSVCNHICVCEIERDREGERTVPLEERLIWNETCHAEFCAYKMLKILFNFPINLYSVFFLIYAELSN